MKQYLHINHYTPEIKYTFCEDMENSEYSKILYVTDSKEKIKIYLDTIGFKIKRYKIFASGYLARVYNYD